MKHSAQETRNTLYQYARQIGYQQILPLKDPYYINLWNKLMYSSFQDKDGTKVQETDRNFWAMV